MRRRREGRSLAPPRDFIQSSSTTSYSWKHNKNNTHDGHSKKFGQNPLYIGHSKKSKRKEKWNKEVKQEGCELTQTRVCDEGIAAVVDGNVIGGIDLFGGEGGEEEAAARPEVVGGEGVEWRNPRRKCCGGDGVGGVLV